MPMSWPASWNIMPLAAATGWAAALKPKQLEMPSLEVTPTALVAFSVCDTELWFDWVDVLRRRTRHKIGHFGDVPQANLLAWYDKNQNLAQQKHAFTNQTKCTTTQKTPKTKARFSRLLWHLAWKRSRSILKGEDKYHLFCVYFIVR